MLLPIDAAWTVIVLGSVVGLALAADAEKPVGRTVYYSGTVQGVGFRYTAVAISKDYAVTGWVKNLADGRVQMVVEGAPDAVRAFIEAVGKRWKDNITKADVETQPPTGKYQSFTVKSE